jgi:hypothetical protein
MVGPVGAQSALRSAPEGTLTHLQSCHRGWVAVAGRLRDDVMLRCSRIGDLAAGLGLLHTLKSAEKGERQRLDQEITMRWTKKRGGSTCMNGQTLYLCCKKQQRGTRYKRMPLRHLMACNQGIRGHLHTHTHCCACPSTRPCNCSCWCSRLPGAGSHANAANAECRVPAGCSCRQILGGAPQACPAGHLQAARGGRHCRRERLSIGVCNARKVAARGKATTAQYEAAMPKLTHQPTHPPTNPPTHPPTHPPTRRVNDAGASGGVGHHSGGGEEGV